MQEVIGYTGKGRRGQLYDHKYECDIICKKMILAVSGSMGKWVQGEKVN